MSDPNILFDTLNSKLKVCRFNNSRTKEEIIIRCEFCGDSIKNSSHAHFFIENKSPYIFYCQKCGIKGIFSKDTAKEFGIFDTELFSHLTVVKNELRASLGEKKYKMLYTKNISTIIPPMKYDSIELRNINYINERIGAQFDSTYVQKLKLVLNVEELYNVNNLDSLNYDKVIESKIDLFNEHYVGFLSYDKNFISFRNISAKDKRRYEIFNIFGALDNTAKFYTIQGRINLLNPNFKLIITEGIFDIISVWHNIYNELDEENVIFVAATGTGFMKVFTTFMRFGFLDMDVEFYADSDFLIDQKEKYNNAFFKKIKDNFIFNSFEVFYNTKLDPKEKTDFGVPKSEIIIKKRG